MRDDDSNFQQLHRYIGKCQADDNCRQATEAGCDVQAQNAKPKALHVNRRSNTTTMNVGHNNTTLRNGPSASNSVTVKGNTFYDVNNKSIKAALAHDITDANFSLFAYKYALYFEIKKKLKTEKPGVLINDNMLHDYILNPANAIYQEISPLCVAEFQQHISDHNKRLQVANDIVNDDNRNKELAHIYNNEWKAANAMQEMHRQFPGPGDANMPLAVATQ